MTKSDYDLHYRKNNVDHIKVVKAEYYRKNRAVILRKISDYHIRNRAAIAASQKRYYLRNRERLIKATQKRYDRDKRRIYDLCRRQKPGYQSTYKKYLYKWRLKNPEKMQAHSAVARAVLAGRLIRLPCEVCGSKKSHGHHHDYSKPLVVRWLCALHNK